MPTSPKTQDPDPLKSTKPSSTERAAPMTPSPKTPGTSTVPADITNEPTAQSISHESTPQGASNELTTQGISSEPTSNDTSQVTPQDTSNQATPTTTPIPPRSKSKPGPKPKYKARDYTSPWRKQFERRCPTTLPDGSLMLRPYVPATHYYQSPAQLAAMRTRKKNMQDPDATQDHDNQDHETTHRSPDADQDQEIDITISAPDVGVSRAEEASTESSQKWNDKGKWKRVQPGKSTQHPYFRRDINVPEQVSGDERVFLVDLPTMEDAYLQEAFPYRYPFNDNDGPTQYMPIEWYIPQGPFAAEDFFSMQKLQYSSSIMKTMKFWNEGLPLEQYYAHGFEMASRVVLDRERSRIIKEHKAARPDIPLLQPMEKLLASIAAAEETTTVFETDADVRSTPPVPLSNGACRILQTLLGDIETKIVAMGCHRQRQELTRLLAEKDAFNVQMAERAVKAAKDAAEAEKAAQAEKDAAAIAAAIAAKNMPSRPVASHRRRKRRRKKPVDETLPVPKVEQTIKTGYQYERLHVDDMDEYMEKWNQTQYNRVRESSVDPPMTTTTPLMTTRKRKYGQPGNDQGMTENGPNAGPSAIVSPRERTPSVSGDDRDESQSGLGFRRGSRPYIDDPMRIGTSMDPFLKARDFLANRFFQEQARNAASEPLAEGSQSAGPSSAP
ncbi:hypothetical protein BG006_006827 [Podila minutissima]|uniref:Uncharacterized protein n=1 Tax=Podila minutissima TaxID=64525 RepID=A0A9P5SL30_9FUNG|nr:hypothetical protein BG006_006827 [Podila minutissima]